MILFSNILGKLDNGSLNLLSLCSYQLYFCAFNNESLTLIIIKMQDMVWLYHGFYHLGKKINSLYRFIFAVFTISGTFILVPALYKYFIFMMNPYFISILAVKFDSYTFGFSFYIAFNLIHKNSGVISSTKCFNVNKLVFTLNFKS